jgi:hypothetical protein
MNKRDKLKLKKLKMKLRLLAKQYDAFQSSASDALDNISSPPELDDEMFAEDVASCCKRMAEIQYESEDTEEKIYELEDKGE